MLDSREPLIDLETRNRGWKLHGELTIYCHGHNPRPEIEWNRVAVTLFDEGIQWLEQINLRRFDGGYYARTCLEMKHVKRRNIVERDRAIIELDELRSAIHHLLLENARFDWKE